MPSQRPSQDLTVAVGEGGLGAEGVITLVDTQAERLEWLMIFDWSNPFKYVSVHDNCIVATSTHDDKWTIDLRMPEKGPDVTLRAHE